MVVDVGIELKHTSGGKTQVLYGCQFWLEFLFKKITGKNDKLN